MKLNTKWLISVLVLIVLIAWGFNTHRDPGTTTNTIKVGVIAPISGQYSALGESFINAVKLAAAKDPRIELIIEDSKFDAKVGLSAYQKLTSIDQVDLIINEDSLTYEVIAPLAKQSGLPLIQIFETKLHEKDNVFQMLPFSYPIFSNLGKLAQTRYGNIGLVYSNALDVYVTDAQYFKQGVTDPQVKLTEFPLTANSDLRTEVTKILAAKPEAVTMVMPLVDGIKFLKELNSQKGERKVALICDANIEVAINEYLEALPASYFEGCLSTNLPNMMTEEFKREYREQFKSDPLMAADWGYDAVTIVSGLTDLPKDQWLEKIQATNFSGVSGEVKFDENGTRIPASENRIFKNGKFISLDSY